MAEWNLRYRQVAFDLRIAFDAVVSAYEFAATYLVGKLPRGQKPDANIQFKLCMANPSHTVVIPWSWAMLQLAPVVRERGSALISTSEPERHESAKCLLRLV